MASDATINSRALPRKRADLARVAQPRPGHVDWTIKDPIALRYYQLREEERFLLDLLDGQHTEQEMIEKFEQRFAPRRLRPVELAAFLLLLQREGLAVGSLPGQGERLLERGRRLLARQRLERWTNPLAIPLVSWNPRRLLNWLMERMAWVCGPLGMTAVAVVMATAVLLLATQFGTITRRLPQLHDFFGPANLMWLGVTLAVVKTLHELGHAVACRHWGGDCHRVGILLLMFSPTLYCDVSDAWLFPRRYQRILVNAAGMIVELFLASLATIVWSFTAPGLVNSLCLNVMVVCSISTLLINGNPLLRYDGYYILADLLATPNLRQQAGEVLDRLVARWGAGVDLEQPRRTSRLSNGTLLSYALASWVYRLFATCGVLWLIHESMQSRGLTLVAYGVATMTVVAMLISPAIRVGRFVRDPRRRRELRMGRLSVSAVVLLAALGAVLFLPLPRWVTAPVVLRPHDARWLYATTPGRLAAGRPAGAEVAAGDWVARLKNESLEMELAELESRVAVQRLHVDQLKLRQQSSAASGDELPAATKALSDLAQQLEHKRQAFERLELRAPLAGQVLPPRRRATESATDAELPGFAGTPLDADNVGCLVESGMLVAIVGDPQRLEAIALVDEDAVQLLVKDQPAKLRLDAVPGRRLNARVAEVAQVRAEDLPPELVEGRYVATTRARDQRLQAMHTYYQVVLQFDAESAPLLINHAGWCRITVSPQALGPRVVAALRGLLRAP